MPRTLLPAACLALLAGCASQAGPSAGMANPASVYCQELGGRLQIVETSKGQMGVCMLPDGEQIEEWDLYRRAHPEEKT
ncbi:putative hemolysin [Bordetella petrii]|uniref:putative hemolysin n=1 Tax=Bordetella petrii TaxID=94624 RepID=UPI001A97799D|nr:DUF333 domain-containing protein [Bordetella petrii]MBO1113546.1 DUF333 domain-containing protein [Bordetella petrii]